jgi:biopolymer transport protein ExbB
MPDLARVQTLWELFLAGGALMWPIVAMSLVVVTFGIERLIALRRSRFLPKPLEEGVEQALKASPFDPRSVYALCQEHPSAAADVIRAMLERLGRPMPEIERAAETAKESAASAMYANIRPISLAVTVTPLLGLLGTVQGMILAFYTTANLDPGANRAAELASGIYVALITTFAGLCVAIPAAMIAHFLEGRILAGFRRIDRLLGRLTPRLERYENKGRVKLKHLLSPPGTPSGNKSSGNKSSGNVSDVSTATPAATRKP